MNPQWYYAQDGKTLGPVTGETLQDLSRQGNLSPSDLVWREGMSDWVAAATIGLVSTAPRPPTLPPTTRPTVPPAPPPVAPTVANYPHTIRRQTTVQNPSLLVWGASLLVVLAVSGTWLVINLSRATPRDSTKIAQRNKLQGRTAESPDGNESQVRGVARTQTAVKAQRALSAEGSSAATQSLANVPVPAPFPPAKSADEVTGDIDRVPAPALTPAIPPGDSNPVPVILPDAPSFADRAPVPQTPAPQPGASATEVLPARTTLFQQVDIQRRPQFSMQGFETAQNIHYQLLSRLDVEPQPAGRRKVVQFVQETRLLAADDLSRDAFAKSLERLKKQQYTYVLNDRGEVIKFTGHKENLESLTVDLASASGFAVTSVIDEDGWKELAELTFLIPDRQTPAKQPWRRQMTHDWGSLGSWSGMTTFERGREVNGLQQIQYSHQMTYSKPVAAGGALPFKIVDARFEPQQAGGRLEFDVRRQQVRLAQEVFVVRGAVTAELLGQAIEIQLSEEQRIEVRIFDQSPGLQTP